MGSARFDRRSAEFVDFLLVRRARRFRQFFDLGRRDFHGFRRRRFFGLGFFGFRSLGFGGFLGAFFRGSPRAGGGAPRRRRGGGGRSGQPGEALDFDDLLGGRLVALADPVADEQAGDQ